MTTPPLDLPALRDRCVKALDAWTKGPTPPYLVFDASDVLALLDRVEAAEAAVAAVREVLEHLTFVADDKYGDLAASQYYGDSELEAVAAKSIARALDGGA